ncbi:MAG TPA: SAM-dependent methyltransferase [Candidatus Acidoferrum sp.]|jgi:tRNA-Thr(GGU) m(6)t(6)A37 methyltransferase TsaA|nr:SAM-dependent methyltransferase [Candidatus Acidoferrum sp.]
MITLEPIGYVSSPRDDTCDDYWGDVEARIELRADFAPEAFAGIDEFSHVEALYFLDRVPENRIERAARHPRGNSAWPRVGIFAQRGKNRPNRLGVSVARLVRREGRQLVLQGLDAINGTPVLDIKPVMREFLPAGEVRPPAWSHELMSHYWR